MFDLTGKTALVTGGKHGLLGPIWVETLKEAKPFNANDQEEAPG